MYLDVFSLSVPPQSIDLRVQSLQTVDGYLNLYSPGFILSTGHSRRLLDLISVKFRLVTARIRVSGFFVLSVVNHFAALWLSACFFFFRSGELIWKYIFG